MSACKVSGTSVERWSTDKFARNMRTSFVSVMLISGWMILFNQSDLLNAQTEGDVGYNDYNDAYDDSYEDDSGAEPAFDVPIVNVTVVSGQTAVLPCSIDALGKHKVAWLDHKSIPLTYDDRRVVDDFRFSVVRPYIKEWNLQIRDIKWEDQGDYRCTINTNPVRSKKVMLHVKVPAMIIDELSSNDVTVQEGDVVILICNVTGVPKPDVTWYRRPAASAKSTERERVGMAGEMIIIQNVSRYCDDIYECVASNGVPPSVSRQMRVTVEFAPEVTLPNRRLGQMRGRETILECIITGYPLAMNYWEKDGRRLTSSAKYRLEAYDEGDSTLVLSLRIHDLDPTDYGEYKCVAANALGRDEKSMFLYEYTEVESEKVPRATLPRWSTLSHTQPVVTYSPRTHVPARLQRTEEAELKKGKHIGFQPSTYKGAASSYHSHLAVPLLLLLLTSALTSSTATTARRVCCVTLTVVCYSSIVFNGS